MPIASGTKTRIVWSIGGPSVSFLIVDVDIDINGDVSKRWKAGETGPSAWLLEAEAVAFKPCTALMSMCWHVFSGSLSLQKSAP